MKDIHIVLLNYFMKEDILRAIASLIEDIQNCPYEVQITVADNGENKDNILEDLRERFPKVQYIDCNGNIGFGRGNVCGFKSVEARYYFALNPDTVIQKNSNTIERIVEYLDKNPHIGCIGPKLLNEDGTVQDSCYRFDLRSIGIKPLKQIHFDQKSAWVKKHSDHLLMKDFDRQSTRPVDWVLGAALIVRKEVIDQIGWFDERYFMYLEDCDWCRNMWEHGWSVYYVHDIVIMHRHERGSAHVPGIFRALLKNRLARIHLASWIKYLWKWRHNHKYYGSIS